MRFPALLALWIALTAPFASLPAQAAVQLVNFENPAPQYLGAGDIVIVTRARALYFLVDGQRALRYPVAVPKAGKDWMGYTYVTGKFWQPEWVPPSAVRNDHPELPSRIPGGAPNNPMGVAAITLEQHEIAIHGTTSKMRSSIGTAASYGCIRMYNEDVQDLFGRVNVNARVLKQ